MNEIAKLIMLLVAAVAVVWLAWRAFVFICLLLKPARAALKPYVDPANAHLDETLRRSGLGALADIAKRAQAGLDGAVDATQKSIEERKKVDS